jgi:rRNA maturation protein Nop10
MGLWACPKCKVLTNTLVCQTCGNMTEYVQPDITELVKPEFVKRLKEKIKGAWRP